AMLRETSSVSAWLLRRPESAIDSAVVIPMVQPVSRAGGAGAGDQAAAGAPRRGEEAISG
ncbi:hypothetical protein J8J40_25535, partial [Mycobacterium tuberculosis]|nr:hypothetical protein [Mycobacterium tuberculosis]